MRPYETMLVLSTSSTETGELIDRFAAVIEREGGVIDARHDWGVRRLSFEVQRQTQGHYWLLDYSAGPDVVKELERNIRIAEGVLCYLSIQQPHTGLPEPRTERSDEQSTGGHRDVAFHRLHSHEARPASEQDRSAEVKSPGGREIEQEKVAKTEETVPDSSPAAQAEPVAESGNEGVEKDD